MKKFLKKISSVAIISALILPNIADAIDTKPQTGNESITPVKQEDVEVSIKEVKGATVVTVLARKNISGILGLKINNVPKSFMITLKEGEQLDLLVDIDANSNTTNTTNTTSDSGAVQTSTTSETKVENKNADVEDRKPNNKQRVLPKTVGVDPRESAFASAGGPDEIHINKQVVINGKVVYVLLRYYILNNGNVALANAGVSSSGVTYRAVDDNVYNEWIKLYENEKERIIKENDVIARYIDITGKHHIGWFSNLSPLLNANSETPTDEPNIPADNGSNTENTTTVDNGSNAENTTPVDNGSNSENTTPADNGSNTENTTPVDNGSNSENTTPVDNGSNAEIPTAGTAI